MREKWKLSGIYPDKGIRFWETHPMIVVSVISSAVSLSVLLLEGRSNFVSGTEVRFSASFLEPRYIRKTPIFTVGIESLSQFKPVPICTFANTVSLLTILQSNQVIS